MKGRHCPWQDVLDGERHKWVWKAGVLRHSAGAALSPIEYEKCLNVWIYGHRMTLNTSTDPKFISPFTKTTYLLKPAVNQQKRGKKSELVEQMEVNGGEVHKSQVKVLWGRQILDWSTSTCCFRSLNMWNICVQASFRHTTRAERVCKLPPSIPVFVSSSHTKRQMEGLTLICVSLKWHNLVSPNFPLTHTCALTLTN